MKTDADAKELARLMRIAAEHDHRSCTAVLTDMNRPLGMCIGNALEVREAIAVLSGDTKSELGKFCITLAAELLTMAGVCDAASAEARAEHAVTSGQALDRLRRMIEAQGGDPHVTENPELLKLSPLSRILPASADGYVSVMQSEEIGRASVLLGAGRLEKDAPIDFGAGIRLHVTRGDAVHAGDPLLTMYAAKESQLDEAEAVLRRAVCITPDAPAPQPLIHSIEK